MSAWKQVYEKWNAFDNLDQSLKLEMKLLKEEQSALEDAFYKDLTFGTGGMRGVLGPGTNRMNIYTVRKAVNGLANYLLVNRVNVKDRGVVIAYDTRYQSQDFAVEAAKVLGVYGIKTHIFDCVQPTPLLSFAVRYLGAAAGIMVTASHNPPEYNGFKVYNEDGGQITPDEADQITAFISKNASELQIPFLEKQQLVENGLLKWIENEINHAYLERLRYISRMDSETRDRSKDLQIVFTPLHGTASNLVTSGLDQLGFSHVHVVEEQVKADPMFQTVASPNPEEPQAFAMAMELGEKVDADILLGTDPDADRLGVAVKDQSGEYSVLTGNQLGSLLLDYVLRHSDPVVYQNARMIKSVVTTDLGQAIAESYQVETIDTLTGFKYIGDKIRQFDATGETFIFGFEESHGYLTSGFVRDKDAVQASMMAAEMAYYWKQKGKTLFDVLQELYEKHGYYSEGLSSLTLKGQDGLAQINSIMNEFRDNPLTTIAGVRVNKIENYYTSERKWLLEDRVESIDLPKENMMKFYLENNAWICIRPSGTEPKIKYYYGIRGTNQDDSKQRLNTLKNAMDEVIDEILAVKA